MVIVSNKKAPAGQRLSNLDFWVCPPVATGHSRQCSVAADSIAALFATPGRHAITQTE
jgi:hypothetical protein